MSADVLRYFVVESYLEKFMTEERTALTTDRESAVMFGLPIRLAEGVLVGRKLENDAAALVHIKESLPEVYICNLDGNVIVA